MAYPKEKEHVAYLQYVENTINNGGTPLKKGEWRKQIKNKDNKVSQVPSALSNY